jgi:hypothetical protein
LPKSTKILELYTNLLNIATTEFRTVVESGKILYSQSKEPWKLRLYICDDSFIDIYYSVKGKYSYHRDRRFTFNKIYRHDNAPHKKWRNISTFPKHFHDSSEDIVVSSHISDFPELALREFLRFVVRHIVKE